jgi:hypothetical protein
MKGMKITLVLMAAVLIAFGLSSSAFAYHNGGVAHCDGCHSMHNSADNPIIDGTGSGQVQAATANNKLLKGSDDSSTCLNCHYGSGGYHIMSADGSNNSQGGDFYWINKDYTYWPGHGSTQTSVKQNHGHSIVAADYGLAADPDNAAAPGGSYVSTNLACTSCHNPHGNGTTKLGGAPISGSGSYGAPAPTDGSTLGHYRLLGGTEYTPPGGTQFTNAAPVARATNGAHGTTDSYGYIVDYGRGMSEWCSNCHGTFTGSTTKHPAGNAEKLTAEYITNYNNYLATGDYGNITAANSFDGLVPFERAISDPTTLSTDPVAGVDVNSNVMCLTCHRAHASANDNAGKWDFSSEFLTESHALISPDVDLTTAAVYYKGGTNGMTTNDIVGEYGEWQRSLCNKCHGWD